jgi:CheY-like chemotaxis protein
LHEAQLVNANGGRVLVVDDEPAIRALVAKIVDRAGLPVDTAGDGSEAIARMEATSYSVVVVDLMMPIIDVGDLIAAAARSVREETKRDAGKVVMFPRSSR